MNESVTLYALRPPRTPEQAALAAADLLDTLARDLARTRDLVGNLQAELRALAQASHVSTGSGPGLVSYAEAAKWLQVDRRTVERWVQHGRLPVVYLTPALPRIRTADLDRIARDGLL